MGLSRKPSNPRKLTWEELDTFLQTVFSAGNGGEISIVPSSYVMSKSEIISELAKNGYDVTDCGDYLTVR